MLSNFRFPFHLVNKKNAFLFVLIVSFFLCFIKLGGESVNDWDEARNGVNAFEMLQNHDFINLYYNQEPDTWNNKPPLLIWLIALSYKIFGFNEFALRFPSAVATIIFFIFFFKLICLYEEPLFAVLACIILFSTKSIIGAHVGRTGDFDALLICFLIIAAYYFLLYADSFKPVNIYLSSVFLGLGFLTKGTASLLLLPGFLIYLIINKKFRSTVTGIHTLFSALLYLVFVAGWIFCVYHFGKTYNPESSEFHHRNAIETLFIHDTFYRLTSHSPDPGYDHNWFYFFRVIDAKLNVWSYLFFLTMIVLTMKFFRMQPGQFSNLLSIENKLFSFSLIQSFTVGLILTLSVNKLPWYLAPALPFIAIIIAYGAKYFFYSVRFFNVILYVLILFTFTRNFVFLVQPHTELKDFFSKNRETIEKYNKVCIIHQPSQSYFLYLEWNFAEIIPRFKSSQSNLTESDAIFCFNKNNKEALKYKTTACFGDYCLGEKQTLKANE